ncbi:hypothetical protein [Cohnella soli]|uniref:Uncharacterized protein n=1 Tax=Cohnella soli TaxID=425005 RepID=A0ABW0HLA1_9BACL
MSTNKPIGEAFMRKILLINAVSSGGCGLILLLLSGYVSDWMGLSNQNALVETGIFLLVFVTILLWTASRSLIAPIVILVIAVLDILWVVGSVILLEDEETTSAMTVLGEWAVALVAVVVGIFAIFEASYWWRNRSFGRSQTIR